MGTVTPTEPDLVDVAVFPNPTQTTLTVTFGRLPVTPTDLILLNTNGQSIVRRAVNSVKEIINVANLPAGLYVLPLNRLSLDIERFQETDTRILRIKTDTRVPESYRNLSDADFVAAYKKAMRNLYAEGLRYVRQHADLAGIRVSSYADTPVLNTYLNVPTFTWADWTKNLSRTNYLVQDSLGRGIGGPYYEQLDALSPSAYYYYDYPNPLAKDYLAYLLFQVEVNRAWSTKPVVPWIWLRYHDSSGSFPNFIQPFMAEATANFSVLFGSGWFVALGEPYPRTDTHGYLRGLRTLYAWALSTVALCRYVPGNV
eukprot:TRINITY_DN2184_c0_g1_i1.p1 TRINITY_DN2184_c0_g1~~TRINITY_DN2184_c0_g1_i1.p1  ORF type:complete len:313 (-),score=-38.69 TRINITY_DN2184_c0_g1_i1:133-1071(-)